MEYLDDILDFDEAYKKRAALMKRNHVELTNDGIVSPGPFDYYLSKKLTHILHSECKYAKDVIVLAESAFHKPEVSAYNSEKAIVIENKYLSELVLKIFELSELSQLREGVKSMLQHEVGHIRHDNGKEVYAECYSLSRIDDPIRGLAGRYAIYSYLTGEEPRSVIKAALNDHLSFYASELKRQSRAPSELMTPAFVHKHLENGFPIKDSAKQSAIRMANEYLNILRKHSDMLPTKEGCWKPDGAKTAE